MSTLNIMLKLDESSTITGERYVLEAKNKREAALRLSDLLRRIAGGNLRANLTVQTGASSPVAASGTITLASVAADDTVVIGGVTLTAKASPSGENQFSQAGTNTQDAAALAAKINAHSTLSLLVSATSSGAVVTVTALQKGVVGNQIPMSQTGGTMTLSAATLANGAGGATSSGQSYNIGLS
jgi:phage tail sheath gpL-like